MLGNGKGCYYQFDDNAANYRYILSITSTYMGQFNTYNPKFSTKIRKATERTIYISGKLSTKYTQQAFVYAFRIFHHRLSLYLQLPKALKGHIYSRVEW